MPPISMDMRPLRPGTLRSSTLTALTTSAMALLETAVPTEIQEGRWEKCEYRDAAGKLVQGKDVTV